MGGVELPLSLFTPKTQNKTQFNQFRLKFHYMLTFRCLNGLMAPHYLTVLLHFHNPVSTLRSTLAISGPTHKG